MKHPQTKFQADTNKSDLKNIRLKKAKFIIRSKFL